MRTLILSDHTSEMVMQAKNKRADEYMQSVDNYLSAQGLRLDCINAQKGEIKSSWKNGNILSVLVGIVRLGQAYLATKPKQPIRQSISKDETVWASGSEGERKVSDYLTERLHDDWTLISGYRNAKGEIDQILVGPRGVFAIEIKYINGVVHCDGDQWWSDKYDRYGNLVKTGSPIADKRGRGPSKQLNDSADRLQMFLEKRIGISRVHRSVVLSHNSSRLGAFRNITVDVIATVNDFDLNRLFARSTIKLDAIVVDRVIQAIRKDHEYHEKPKSHRYKQANVN